MKSTFKIQCWSVIFCCLFGCFFLGHIKISWLIYIPCIQTDWKYRGTVWTVLPAVGPHSFGLISRFSLLHLQTASLFMVIVSLSGLLKEETCTSAWWTLRLRLTGLMKFAWAAMDSSKTCRRLVIKTYQIILPFCLMLTIPLLEHVNHHWAPSFKKVIE